MRLIDADELINHLRKDPLFPLVERYGITGVIEAAPTIDPVRHGNWISVPHKKDRICSVCEGDEPYKFSDKNVNVFDYCPHCGAKMDGGEDDGDLISRQAAYDTLTEYYHHKTEIQHKSLKEALSRVPTIDHVKHGKWLRTEAFPHHVYCSVCSKTYIPNDRWQIWTDRDLPRDYCPNCGARMDGGEENG